MFDREMKECIQKMDFESERMRQVLDQFDVHGKKVRKAQKKLDDAIKLVERRHTALCEMMKHS